MRFYDYVGANDFLQNFPQENNFEKIYKILLDARDIL